jgi:hypothetical protein
MQSADARVLCGVRSRPWHGLAEQFQCPACHRWKPIQRKHGRTCNHCHHHPPKPLQSTPPITAEQRMTNNVADFMALLPPHSHHRAPLVHFLSRGLESATAAKYLNCSPSYVRQCKRKQFDNSDLVQDKYARDVKRQKLAPPLQHAVLEYLASACPTESGERSVTLHQFVSDDALYKGYSKVVTNPISFHTFYNMKRWLRIKRTGSYFGLFDCAKCYSLKQLPSLIASEEDYAKRVRLQQELEQCQKHQQLN